MYAVIGTGGKQLRVAVGDVVKVERLVAKPGEAVDFADVLLVSGEAGTTVGTPHVAGATVRGTVLSEGRHRKVKIFKKKRRKQYRRTKGHRQGFSSVRIDEIAAGA
ncbi:MAG: 50S ribosomal protein L21 [Acidobacteriota bacterium]